MKITNKIKYILLVCVIIGMCFSFLGLYIAKAEQKYEFSLSSSLNETYALGEVIELPMAEYAGQEADFRVKFPDGNYSNKKNVQLSQYGQYVVEYSAINPVSKRVERYVLKFSVTGEHFTVNGVGTTEFKTLSNGITGVYASLRPNDTIVINDVIDLEKYGAKDQMFKMQFMPAVTGETDVVGMEIKIVDVYNENNFVNIRMKQYQDSYAWEHASSFLDACFNDSDYVALFETKSGTYEYDGIKYKRFLNDPRYGASVSISMTGSTGTRTAPINGKYPFGIIYDEETGRLACSVYGAYKLVSDLHNLNLYGKAFKGFTDNKVRIEITPTTYSKGSCGLFFTEVNGIKLTESSYNAFTSTDAPEINVDFEGINENALPNARIGVPYSVFSASGFSTIVGELPVDVKVFYGYNNINKMRVNIYDGKFTPAVGGVYTIEYSAIDFFGNKTVKTVDVMAVDNEQKININFENEIDYSSAVNVGSVVKLFDSYNYQSDSGDVDISVVARLQSDSSVEYKITEKNGYSFKPLYSGVYDIVIVANDYSFTQTINKTLNVNTCDVVVYEEVANFPDRLVKNGTYSFNNIKAYSLSSGKPVEVQLELSVYNDSNSTASVTDASNIVISANNKVKLSYKPLGIDFSTEPYEVEIGVLRTGLYEQTVLMKNYFYTEEGRVRFVAEEDGVGCELVEGVDSRYSFRFANVLAGHEFFISFFPLVAEDKSELFEEITFYLYDATDLGKFVKASFVQQNDMWFVSVNDKEMVKIYDSWGANQEVFEFSFNSSKDKIIFDNLVNEDGVKLYGTDEQAIFRDGIMLKIEVVADSDCQGVKINKINNQMISSATSDYSPSIIDMSHDKNAGEKKLGTTIKLDKFVGYDVLTPNVKTTVSVNYRATKQEPWSNIKSVDGVTLKNADASRAYEFVLNECGEYNVNIKVVDEIITDNNASRSYTIVVKDYSKPVVNLVKPTTSGKVGKSIKLASFETEEDLSELVYYFIIVDTNGIFNYTTEESFIAEKAGVYRVTLVVLDSNSNMTQISYDIVVK